MEEIKMKEFRIRLWKEKILRFDFLYEKEIVLEKGMHSYAFASKKSYGKEKEEGETNGSYQKKYSRQKS